MDDKVTEIILYEMREIKKGLERLEKSHTSLRFKVYGIALLLGGLGHTAKDVIVSLFTRS